MAITFALSPMSLTQFFYANGKMVRPARLFFYKPNTEDPVTVYTDPTLGIPHNQPVLSGGSGRVPPIYVGTQPYRVMIFDSNGSLVEDIDYISGAIAAGEPGEPGEPGAPGVILQTGDMFFAFATASTLRPGCVRANGGIIGPPGFDHTPYPGQIERLSADTHDLFVWLWGQDGANALTVIGGKGSSAESDWALNTRAIRLPDLRGRALIGLDGMGMAESGRIDFPVVDFGHQNWSSGVGGSAYTDQTILQMPSHNHGQWTGNANASFFVNAGQTGLIIAAGTTGLDIQSNFAGLGVQSGTTGITINDALTGMTIANFFTTGADIISLGESPVTHGISELVHSHTITDSGHIHNLLDAGHDHGIIEPNGGIGHGHGIIEPNGGIGHSHGITQTPHRHEVGTEGGGDSMQTISPFSTAVVYIKL